METELMHYGVKGMRWGVRRNKYVTIRQGMKNANAAGRAAWQETTTANGGKLIGKDKNVAVYKNPVAMRRGRVAAQTARNDAIKESIKNDKAVNKAERQRIKAEKKQIKADKNRQKRNVKRGAKAAVTALQVVGTLYSTDVALTGGAVTRATYKAGKTAVKSAMNKVGDTLFDYAVLDASGKVIRRYN
jgi:hypothetical protein